jgi:hypothetical protein
MTEQEWIDMDPEATKVMVDTDGVSACVNNLWDMAHDCGVDTSSWRLDEMEQRVTAIAARRERALLVLRQLTGE